MKRFWKSVVAVEEQGGWAIYLDGRPLRTPARAMLLLPSQRLADVIAEEWRRAPEDEVKPRAMPVTGLANAAVDQIASDRARFANGLAKYAEADLICYRVEGPGPLVSRQEEHWNALLDWARRRFDVEFRITTGLLHVPQPDETVKRLHQAVGALDPLVLAGLSQLVTIGGSLIAGLAVVELAVSVDQAWLAVSIDERWQLEQWGSDAEAEAVLEKRRRDFFVAAQFVALL
ncbi:MAG: ATP12 family protein [Sphingomicrobium sp.]